MDPNDLNELQINTLLNPDFGMNDEGFLMHARDIEVYTDTEKAENEYH